MVVWHKSTRGASLTIPNSILCLSANPALDRRLRLSSLSPGEVQRARLAEGFPGGKAAHVAFAAKALGVRVLWVGFLGGSIGKECADGLVSLGVEAIPIPTKAPTRINSEFIEDSGRITEVLEPGGRPEEAECVEMLQTCSQTFQGEWHGASLVISGSLPAGTSPELYVSLIGIARAAGSRSFLDTSGEPLRAALGAQPDFVKCNRSEAESLLGRSLDTVNEVLRACQEMIGRGARSAAITLGAEGLIWAESLDGPAWIARPPKLQGISTVGCGDATMAGFAYALGQDLGGSEVLRFATACGAANCLAPFEGRISRADVDSLVPRIHLEHAE